MRAGLNLASLAPAFLSAKTGHEVMRGDKGRNNTGKRGTPRQDGGSFLSPQNARARGSTVDNANVHELSPRPALEFADGP